MPEAASTGEWDSQETAPSSSLSICWRRMTPTMVSRTSVYLQRPCMELLRHTALRGDPVVILVGSRRLCVTKIQFSNPVLSTHDDRKARNVGVNFLKPSNRAVTSLVDGEVAQVCRDQIYTELAAINRPSFARSRLRPSTLVLLSSNFAASCR